MFGTIHGIYSYHRHDGDVVDERFLRPRADYGPGFSSSSRSRVDEGGVVAGDGADHRVVSLRGVDFVLLDSAAFVEGVTRVSSDGTVCRPCRDARLSLANESAEFAAGRTRPVIIQVCRSKSCRKWFLLFLFRILPRGI